MDDVRVGSVLRAVRMRRGLRQSDVAKAAGISQAVVSLVERGDLEHSSLRALRQVAASVGVSLPFAPRWRGADLARLLDERHAAMVGLVAERVERRGWQVLPERTFSIQGGRGSIDILGWHSGRRALLIVEVKTVLVDMQDMLSTLDRKRRLAPVIARELGWRPLAIAAIVVLPEETQARHAVYRNERLLHAALPARTLEIRRWLVDPRADLRGIWFLLNNGHTDAKRGRGGSRRVRRRTARIGGSEPRPDEARPADASGSAPRLRTPVPT